MRSNNPVFNSSEAFSQRGGAGVNQAPPVPGQQLEDMYNAPTATGLQTGRMTIDDVVVKTGLMFAVLLPLVVAFKQSTNPALILGYAAAEGLYLGGISRYFEERWGGIVAQAVLATLCV